MVVVDKAKLRIRDIIINDLSYGLYGSDGSEATSSDTEIKAPIAETEGQPSFTSDGRTIRTEYIVNSETATGETFREFGTFFSDDTMFYRVVFPDYDHTTEDELHITVLSRVN